jgi:hypothetical protein
VNIFREALKLISGSRRSYIIINLVYYGVIIVAMVYTSFNRAMQQELTSQISLGFSQGMLSPVMKAYTTGQILSAVGLTFIINLVLGSFISITLPSMIVPFSGYIIFLVRAFLWGIIFSPKLTNIGIKEVFMGALIAILLLLEGQGYILAMFAAHRQGRAFLWPSRVNAATRGRGYLRGMVDTGKLYLLVVLTLVVAAVYEASIAILILPHLV